MRKMTKEQKVNRLCMVNLVMTGFFAILSIASAVKCWNLSMTEDLCCLMCVTMVVCLTAIGYSIFYKKAALGVIAFFVAQVTMMIHGWETLDISLMEFCVFNFFVAAVIIGIMVKVHSELFIVEYSGV